MRLPDVTNKAVLLVIDRYIKDNEFDENLLLCDCASHIIRTSDTHYSYAAYCLSDISKSHYQIRTLFH